MDQEERVPSRLENFFQALNDLATRLVKRLSSNLGNEDGAFPNSSDRDHDSDDEPQCDVDAKAPPSVVTAPPTHNLSQKHAPPFYNLPANPFDIRTHYNGSPRLKEMQRSLYAPA